MPRNNKTHRFYWRSTSRDLCARYSIVSIPSCFALSPFCPGPFVQVWSAEYRACVPRDLLNQLIVLIPYFDGYGTQSVTCSVSRSLSTRISISVNAGQHDAQEFLRGILDNLHEATRVKCDYQRDLTAGNTSDARSTRAVRPKGRAAASSVVADIFQGYLRYFMTCLFLLLRCLLPVVDSGGVLRSEVRCSHCGNVSATEDPFFDLSFELPRDSQLRRVGTERGEQALTPQTNKGWFGTLWRYSRSYSYHCVPRSHILKRIPASSMVGLASKDLSLETCIHSFCTSEDLVKKEQYKVCRIGYSDVFVVRAVQFGCDSARNASRRSTPLNCFPYRRFLKCSVCT